MKLLRVVLRQCERTRRLEARDHLGVRLASCPRKIEHLVVAKGGVKQVSVPCSDCVLAKLYASTFVASPPTVREDGSIQFIVRAGKAVDRLLSQHRDMVLEVEELDYRRVLLTPRQRTALRLLASGEAKGISGLAEKLRVNKSTASRIYRRMLEKIMVRAA